ncbi:MAG: MMPL family transporter [Myxococcales bacterium]|nr:MMPL family transporter [Myxococcales bacterium]
MSSGKHKDSRLLDMLVVHAYRRPGVVLGIALVLTAIALTIAGARFKLATNLAALLPENTLSSNDYEYVKKRIGSPEYMEMILTIKGKGSQRKKNRALARKYLPILEAEAKKLTDIVDFTFIRFPLTFVKQVALLSFDAKRLQELYECLRDLKERSTLGLEDSDEFTDPKKKDCLKRQAKTPETLSSKERTMPGGYFFSTTGYLIWFIKPTKPSALIEWNRRAQRKLLETLNKKIESDPRLRDVFATPIEIGGGYKNRVEEYSRIRKDLTSTAAVTFGLLVLVILAYFRKMRALPLIFIPLVLSITWTLGVTFVVYDNLNLITAFIFAILLGLGIDFGIHLLSRYFEERSRGITSLRAMQTVLQTTGSATTTTALTTMITFWSLLLTSFKGFSQFGFIAGFGVLFALISMFTVLPAVTFLFERWFPLKVSGIAAQSAENDVTNDSASRFQPSRFRFSGMIVIAYLGMCVAAIYLLPQLQFEYDFRNLRSINPTMRKIDDMKDGATQGLTVSPSVALTARGDTAPQIAKILRDRMKIKRVYTRADHFLKRAHKWSWADDGETLDDIEKRLGKRPKKVRLYDTLKAVVVYQDLLPKDQLQKLAIVKKIYKLIHNKTDFIPKKYRNDVVHLQEAASIDRPITPKMIPPLFKRLFREPVRDVDGKPVLVDGKPRYQYGHFALIFPDGSMYNARNAIRYSEQVGDLRVDGRRVRVASASLIFADVIRSMKIDGAKALILSFSSVILIIVLTFAYDFRDRFIQFLVNHLLWFGSLLLLNGLAKFGLDWETCLAYSIVPALMVDLMIFPQAVVRSIFVLTPLIASVVLLSGIMVLFNIKISFYNMIVFPMIIGVGIDNGIHLFHRYMEEGRGSLVFVLRQTGAAIAMATFTSMIGFSGMLVANHLGLQAIGKLALLGLGLCLFVAVTFLLATLGLVEKWKIGAIWRYPGERQQR